MSWRLAKSLEQLKQQINLASPGRNKASDGGIGNAEHASRASDHNPHIKDAKGIGVVTAYDFTHDPGNNVDGGSLSRALKADPQSRVKYIIFDSQIWKARTGKWEPYRGPNAHKHHVHVSVQPDRYDDVSPWPWPPAGSPQVIGTFSAPTFTGTITAPSAPSTPVSVEDAASTSPPDPKVNADVVVVQKENPTPPAEVTSTAGIKGSLVGVLTFVTTSGSAIVAALGGWPSTIIIALFAAAAVVGAIWLVMRFWYANQDKARIAGEREAEAARAHEITVLKMKSAMNPLAPTVEVTHAPTEETK